ncbi:hypothetical protein QJS10_CPB21g01807 [Acorus calamus]|uniref:RNase H type-1 domain-containing protein n=1 Tax=Acorus calamus TaxID=4465 RepID=A0AAV9C276_ACOCL|nr:hypothetical protein QJS10_CPB21g01807 [Acorus calamus]
MQGDINDGERMIFQFILALTIWTIWQARNENFFRQCALSKPLLVRKIILATKSRFSGVSIEDSGSPISLALLSLFGIVLEPKSSISILVKWVLPPPGWVKINSDGSLGEDRYGFGAVVRDSRGDCVLAMVERSQAASINILELKGLLAGLRLQNLPRSLVWSKSDSTMNGRSLMSIEKVTGVGVEKSACVGVLWGFGSDECPGGLGRIVFSEGVRLSFLVEAPDSGSRGFKGLCDRHLLFLKTGKGLGRI